MELCLTKALAMLEEQKKAKPRGRATLWLREVARRLRYQIATREPFVPDQTADLQVATLWGAKGVTAEHVYVLGLCDEVFDLPARRFWRGSGDLDLVGVELAVPPRGN